MKKIYLLFISLFLANAALLAQDTLVFWNFKTAPYDTLADGGNAYNTSDLISRDTSWHNTYTYTTGALGNPDKCISSTDWRTGNGTKYYQVNFSSNTFAGLTFYSRQRSSNSGPKYFKVQYRVSSTGTWTDVTGANVICGTTFSSGTLAGINLPANCDNQPDLYLRWIMTADSSVGGSVVGTAGTSNLDEIYILASTTVGIATQPMPEQYSISPNPCNNYFTVDQNSDAEMKIEILDITGKLIHSHIYNGRRIQVSVADMKSGLYFVRVINLENQDVQMRKLVVR